MSARSATPLLRCTLQNPDARISLTFAATVVATANTELWDLDGPLRQVKRTRQRRLDAPGPESPETQTFSSTEASTGSGDAAAEGGGREAGKFLKV